MIREAEAAPLQKACCAVEAFMMKGLCRSVQRVSSSWVPFVQAVLVAIVATAPIFSKEVQAAAKPILGVSCKGGFFVKSPDRNIFWITESKQRKTVYTQKRELWGMAECGPGVITVFRTDKQTDTDRDYEAFYSPNCLDIGEEQGETTRLYAGKAKVIKITPVKNAVEIKLANKKVIKSSSCSAH